MWIFYHGYRFCLGLRILSFRIEKLIEFKNCSLLDSLQTNTEIPKMLAIRASKALSQKENLQQPNSSINQRPSDDKGFFNSYMTDDHTKLFSLR